MIVLVRAPGSAHAGPVAGVRFPSLQHAGGGCGEQAGGRSGARTLLPHHHRRLTAAAREVQAFREWILEEAENGGREASGGLPRYP